MNRTILLLSVTALVLGGTSAYLWHQLRHEHELRQVSVARAAELEERLRLMAVEKPDVPSHFDTAGPTANSMPAPLTASGASQPKWKTSSDKGRPIERSHAASELPEVRAVKLAEQRLSVRRRLPDLAAALHLQEEEADKLVNLLAEHQLWAEENPPHVPEGELEWDVNNKPEWVRKMEGEQRRRDKEIAELLGEAKFRAWKDYGDSANARTLVRQLRAMLDGTSDSLREDQMPPLVKAVAEAQHRFGAESGNDASTGLERFAKYHERLREAAVPYLSTEQLARFDQMLDEPLEVARARANMEAEIRGAWQ